MNEKDKSIAAIPVAVREILGNLFELLERDTTGHWNFKSLSRDAAKLDNVMNDLHGLTYHPVSAPDPARVFVEAAFQYLDTISGADICEGRTCIRCRIADAAFEIERRIHTAANLVPKEHNNDGE